MERFVSLGIETLLILKKNVFVRSQQQMFRSRYRLTKVADVTFTPPTNSGSLAGAGQQQRTPRRGDDLLRCIHFSFLYVYYMKGSLSNSTQANATGHISHERTC
jgi:hypothetical protein